MQKNLLLMIAATAVTLVLALGLIRWLAPGLLGGPVDLQLVQLDRKMPAFYPGVFRTVAGSSAAFLLKDPLTRVRARPFYRPGRAIGPNDVLGFRNAAVPVAADIVTIGDSMTYGNNTSLQENWPAWMLDALHRPEVNSYNMSVGGWAAVQYLDMMKYAAAFHPYVVVVAFYTGNDPLESFQMVHGNANWKWLMDTEGLDTSGLPRFSLDVSSGEQWPVTFADGVHTVFTPQLRLISNTRHPAIDAGYAIMGKVAGLIAEQARKNGMQPVFTIIPTKELAYAKKVQADGLAAPQSYHSLIEAETGRIGTLASRLRAIDGVQYVDVVTTLQQAALGHTPLYPQGINGHPVAAGYRVIGESIAAAVRGEVPARSDGLYALKDGDSYFPVLVTGQEIRFFQSLNLIQRNGWPEGKLTLLDPRQVARLTFRGDIDRVDPARFGPACCAKH